jgi:hypothetical protein
MDQIDMLQLLSDIPGIVLAVPVVLFLMIAAAGRSRRRAAAPSLARTLRAIKRAPVRAVPVLNASEQSVYRTLLDLVAQSRSHRLLVQVSMGEFLRLDRRGSARSGWQIVFNAFNAKRVDFLIVDADWVPCMAIEYQGSGHYKGNARARDAIKRAVCEKADVAFMEVATDGLSAAQVRDLHDMMSSLGPRVSA